MKLILFKNIYRELGNENETRTVIRQPFADLYGETYLNADEVEAVTPITAKLKKRDRSTETIRLFSIRFRSGANVLIDSDDCKELVGTEVFSELFIH